MKGEPDNSSSRPLRGKQTVTPMSNASYHQPRVELEPTKLLVRTIYAHQGYVSSVAFFGPHCDRLITGSYDETAKVCVCGLACEWNFEFFAFSVQTPLSQERARGCRQLQVRIDTRHSSERTPQPSPTHRCCNIFTLPFYRCANCRHKYHRPDNLQSDKSPH